MSFKIVKVRLDAIQKRYVWVGILNTAIGLSMYPVLYYFLSSAGFGYMNVMILSQIANITIAFITQKKLVFKTEGGYKKEFFKFATYHGIVVAGNLVILPVMVVYAGIKPVFAQTSYACVVILTSYYWHRYITFSEKLR